MAELYLKVPAAWPDFAVTSYGRAEGSHANGTAIDIAISGPWDKSPGSKYWFFYFQTIFMMWQAQRLGDVRCAAPPFCPHFHIDVNPKINVMGLEWVYPRKGKDGKTYCKYANHIQQPKVDEQGNIFSNVVEYNKWFRTIREVSEPFANSWSNWVLEIDMKITRNSKYIQVSNNRLISERDLQNKLLQTFGDGSTSQYILDNTAQIFSYINQDQAKEDIFSSPWFQMLAAGGVAWAFYQLAKEYRYWNPPQRDIPEK